MQAITPGHKYELDYFEDITRKGQVIQFIEKVPSNSVPGELITLNDGTTNEEVLKMLIDRVGFLQDKFPCRENALAITKMEEALMWLEKRTADRKNRGVEGKHLK